MPRRFVVLPQPSAHGDVHGIILYPTDGKSVTVAEYKWVYKLLVGDDITDAEMEPLRMHFAEEDR